MHKVTIQTSTGQETGTNTCPLKYQDKQRKAETGEYTLLRLYSTPCMSQKSKPATLRSTIVFVFPGHTQVDLICLWC